MKQTRLLEPELVLKIISAIGTTNNDFVTIPIGDREIVIAWKDEASSDVVLSEVSRLLKERSKVGDGSLKEGEEVPLGSPGANIHFAVFRSK